MTTTEGRTQIQPVRIHNLELLGEKASMRANLHQLALRVCLGGIILIALTDVESPVHYGQHHSLSGVLELCKSREMKLRKEVSTHAQ